MSERPTKVPGFPKPPSNLGAELRKFLETLVEAIEIRLGRRGDPLDRAITLRELIDSGLAKKLQSSPFDPNSITRTNIGFQDPNTLIGTDIPLRPTGFSVNAAYSTINLGWDYPNYTYHNQTEIWSYASDSLGDALATGSPTAVSTGRGDTDPVGGGVTRYYWIRHVNTAGTVGPWNDTAGTAGTTATDVAHTLNVLNAAITSSQLATALASPIGNLPANTNSSISTINSNITSINSTVGSHTASIHTNVNSIDGVELNYTVKIDNNGYAAGFGLASTTSAEGNAVSEFIIRADRFALLNTTALTATSAWSSSSAYAEGAVVKHGGLQFQAKVAIAANTAQAPSAITGNAGATNWDCLSVPFTVLTSQATVQDDAGNNHTIAPGVYIRSANIQKAAIESAQIHSINAETITTGYLNATDRIDTNAINASKLILDNSTITSINVGSPPIPTVQIKALGVTSAQIGDAAITTLKVDNNAITASGYTSKAFSSVSNETLSMTTSATCLAGQPYLFHIMAIVNEYGTNPESYDLKVTTTVASGSSISNTYWLYAYGTDVIHVVRSSLNDGSEIVACRVDCYLHGTTTSVNNCMIQISGWTGLR